MKAGRGGRGGKGGQRAGEKSNVGDDGNTISAGTATAQGAPRGGGRGTNRGGGRGRGARNQGRGGRGGDGNNKATNKNQSGNNKDQPTEANKGQSQQPKENQNNKQGGGKNKGKQQQQQKGQQKQSETKKNDNKNNNKQNQGGKNNNKGKGGSNNSQQQKSPYALAVPPNQPQLTNDINYKRGETITVLHVAEKPSIAQVSISTVCTVDIGCQPFVCWPTNIIDSFPSFFRRRLPKVCQEGLHLVGKDYQCMNLQVQIFPRPPMLTNANTK